MTEYVWGDLRDKAVSHFRETPGAELEQRIIDVFDQHPQSVDALIETIKAKFDAGKVQSGWALLDYEAQRITTLGQHKATDTTDRNRAIRNAEQRMRSELCHYDRAEEVLDELFGDRGQLRHWPELEERMHDLWVQVRPAGVLVEKEELERADRYKAAYPQGPTPPGRPAPEPSPEPSPEWGPKESLADIEIPF